MIEAVARPTERYHFHDDTLDQTSGQVGLCAGLDFRLQRRVRLWVMQAAEDDPRRAAFQELGQALARLSHPAFLRVFDLVLTPNAAAIVVEDPGSGPLADAAVTPPLTDERAAALVLELSGALEDGKAQGLSSAVAALAPVTYLTGEVARLDPVSLYRDGQGGLSSGGTATLVWGLLASLRPDAQADTAGNEDLPVPSTLDAFLAYWRLHGPVIPPTLDPEFLAGLRAIAAPHTEETGPPGPAPVPDTAPTLRSEPTLLTSPQQRLGFLLGLGAPTAVAALVAAIVLVGTAIGSAPKPAGVGVPRDTTTPPLPTATTGATGAPAETTGAVAVVAAPANPKGATLALTAAQDTQVRVTVDGVAAFGGVIRAGETRSWEGNRRVQLWTNGGKTLQVAVNGHTLGTVSGAVGHPEWNTVDWGWNAGWKP